MDNISIGDPIQQAINRSKQITFGPFNIGKWFSMGFVAFLASLGEGGCGNYRTPNFGGWGGPARPPVPAPAPGPFPRAPSGPGGGAGGGTGGAGSSSDPFNQPLDFLSAHALEAALIVVAIVLVALAIWLVILWINSRGKLMFTYAIANDSGEVVAPWKLYRPLGNSLFGFRAVIAAAGTLLLLLFLGIGVMLAWPDIQSRQFSTSSAIAIIVFAGLMVPTSVLFALINWATNNFVVTIMYARGTTVLPAWQEFRQNVLRGNVLNFAMFLGMQIILTIAVGIAMVILTVVTCCIGALPYLNCVITLPLLVFLRAYPIYFLQQFGPQYMIIREAAPAVGFPVGFPVTPVEQQQYQQPYPQQQYPEQPYPQQYPQQPYPQQPAPYQPPPPTIPPPPESPPPPPPPPPLGL